jgi:hypothetical protein
LREAIPHLTIHHHRIITITIIGTIQFRMLIMETKGLVDLLCNMPWLLINSTMVHLKEQDPLVLVPVVTEVVLIDTIPILPAIMPKQQEEEGASRLNQDPNPQAHSTRSN